MPFSCRLNLRLAACLIILIATGFLAAARPAKALPPGCRPFPPAPEKPFKECCWRDPNPDGTKPKGSGPENLCFAGDETRGLFCVCQPFNGTPPSTTKTNPTAPKKDDNPIMFKPGVTIPGSGYVSGQNVKVENGTEAFAKYVIAIIKYSTGAIGILAVIMLMVGGIMWIGSAGSQETIGKAKTYIAGAIGGMALSLLSFLILSMVNTNLVAFKTRDIAPVGVATLDLVCAIKTDMNGFVSSSDIPKQICAEYVKEIGTKYAAVDCSNTAENFWSAGPNGTCVQNRGCCEITMGPKSLGFVKWPFGGDSMCVENLNTFTCETESSSGLWSVMKLLLDPTRISLVYQHDITGHPHLGSKCSALPECQKGPICKTAAECYMKLEPKPQTEVKP